MAMRTIPVDVSKLEGFICVSAPELRVDPTTGEVRTDRVTREPLYLVGVVCRISGNRAAYVLDIQLVGEPAGLVEGQEVTVCDLVAVPWEVDGRSGMSYRASAITPAHPAAAPAASPGPASSGAAASSSRGAGKAAA